MPRSGLLSARLIIFPVDHLPCCVGAPHDYQHRTVEPLLEIVEACLIMMQGVADTDRGSRQTADGDGGYGEWRLMLVSAIVEQFSNDP
jgi:hypothetical protein